MGKGVVEKDEGKGGWGIGEGGYYGESVCVSKKGNC